MDKCLAYNTDLTLENVVQALGTTDYDTMFKLANNICERCNDDIITCIEELYNSGKDIKQFVKQFTQFLLDVQKFSIIEKWEYISIPKLPDYEKALRDCNYDVLFDVLDIFVKLSSEIKYSSTPKYDVEAAILLYTLSEEEK